MFNKNYFKYAKDKTKSVMKALDFKQHSSDFKKMLDLMVQNPALDKKAKVDAIVKFAAASSALASLAPVPFVSIAGITPIYSIMISYLNKIEGNPFKDTETTDILKEALSYIGIKDLSVLIASELLKGKSKLLGLGKFAGTGSICRVAKLDGCLIYILTFALGMLVYHLVVAKSNKQTPNPKEAEQVYETARSRAEADSRERSIFEQYREFVDSCRDYEKFQKGLKDGHKSLHEAVANDNFEEFKKHYNSLKVYIRTRIHECYSNISIRNEGVLESLALIDADEFIKNAECIIADISRNYRKFKLVEIPNESTVEIETEMGYFIAELDKTIIEIREILFGPKYEKNKNIAYLSSKDERIWFKEHKIANRTIKQYEELLKKIYTKPESITTDDRIMLRAIFNKCKSKDCWDWCYVYDYLGRPHEDKLQELITESFTLTNGEGVDAYRKKHQYLFDMFKAHLDSNDVLNISDDELNIPIKDLDDKLWAKLDYESKKNLKIIEHIDQKLSAFFLMFYFATLEKEFRIHLIEPFVRKYGQNLVASCSVSNKWEQTNDVLTGEKHFSLGAIWYLGQALIDENSKKHCRAIKEYVNVLGDKRKSIATLCQEIGSEKINGLYITRIRNGLAHGLPEVTSRLDNSTYIKLGRFLTDKTDGILVKILANSLRQELK